MSEFPVHKAVWQIEGGGIYAKRVTPERPNLSGYDAHRDDYYIFGRVESGICCVEIDNQSYRLSAGDWLCVHPHQIHRILSVERMTAFLLFVDGVFVETSMKRVLAEYALSPEPFRVKDSVWQEELALSAVLLSQIAQPEHAMRKTILQHLSGAFVGMLVQELQQKMRRRQLNHRYVEIALAFRELLSSMDRVDRHVSFYAERLHLSPGYLNESIKQTMGMSISQSIQQEWVLRAKRMLLYGKKNISEIAVDLGIDDPAYFARRFRQTTGLSPSAYRKKYRE